MQTNYKSNHARFLQTNSNSPAKEKQEAQKALPTQLNT